MRQRARLGAEKCAVSSQSDVPLGSTNRGTITELFHMRRTHLRVACNHEVHHSSPKFSKTIDFHLTGGYTFAYRYTFFLSKTTPFSILASELLMLFDE